MLSLKNVWTFGMIVVTFVFLPPENWDYWFAGGKSDRYAEFCFRGDKHCYVIAKNLLTNPVHLGFANIKSAWTGRIGSPNIEELKTGGTLPPNSYSLLEVAPASVNSVIHTLEPEYSFSPKQLMLVAPIEEDKWFVLVFALVVAAALLTYSIGSLVREDDRQKGGRQIDYSWPSPK